MNNRPMSTKKKTFFSMNIGSASMLLIFIILCLVSFAALSLVSANADKRLSQKIADRTLRYYEACNGAEQSLSGLDAVLQSQFSVSETPEDYFATVGHTKSYAIPISDTQTLYVEIEILYPETSSQTFYRILSWQVIADSSPMLQ